MPLKLHWKKPVAPDLDRVVVVLNLKHAPRGPADGRVIDRGLRTTATFKFGSHANAHIALYAYDHSGNVSRASRQIVSLPSLIPLRPLGGSVVRKAPQLRWKPHRHTLYYNLQLFRNGHRILVRWPSHPFYRLPAGMLRPGHLRLVGLAGDEARGRPCHVREADRAIDVRGETQAAGQGAVTAHSPNELAGPAPGAVK